MPSLNERNLLKLIRNAPVNIAYELGYEKLTSLHNRWIFDMVFGKGDKTIQGHRGSFKTTCLVVSFGLLLVLYPFFRSIFIRKTDTDVAEVMNATSNVLSNPYFKAMAQTFYHEDLIVTTSTQSAVNTNLVQGVSGAPQLLGLGCGASITGKHADRVYTDDIVNVKDRVSAAERERIKLLYQELQNIRNRGGRIFNTGTPWHKDDAFNLMPNIERFDCYSTGLMTKEEIEHVRGSMTRSLFAANYELKHIADEDAMFGEPSYFADPELLRDGIGHIDAAYGGEDGTAFTCISRRDSRFHVYGRLWPSTPVDKVLPEIISLAKALRIGTIYTEKNADKGYLKRDILKLGHPAIAYPENMNKYIKVATYLKGEWENVSFLDCDRFPLDADYVNQVLDYNENAAHDDAPDSLASAIRQFGRKPGMAFFKDSV